MTAGPSTARSRRAAALALAGASLLSAAALGSVFLRTAGDAWTAISSAGPAGPADGILLAAGLGGTLLSLWLGLGLTLSAMSALPGGVGHLSGQLASQVAPAAMRKVVAFVLGTTLTAALIPGNAVAGDLHQAPAPVVAAAPYEVRSGGMAVAAPDASFRLFSDPRHVNDVAEAAPAPEWSPKRPASTGGRVVVLRGDTLWSIAARHLGPAATAADVDTEWRSWFAENRDVIGADANLILPGQLLGPPRSPGAGS